MFLKEGVQPERFSNDFLHSTSAMEFCHHPDMLHFHTHSSTLPLTITSLPSIMHFPLQYLDLKVIRTSSSITSFPQSISSLFFPPYPTSSNSFSSALQLDPVSFHHSHLTKSQPISFPRESQTTGQIVPLEIQHYPPMGETGNQNEKQRPKVIREGTQVEQ